MVSRRPLVLVLVQNLPLPGDRRVWLECKSLRDNGFRVAAITPAGPGDPAYEVLEDVHLFKYRPPGDANSTLDFFWEFIYCWLRTFALTLKVTLKLGRPKVIQSCNPPDTFFLIGVIMRAVGTRFVFDQHDLNPEVYESRFGKQGLLYRGLMLLERLTYRTAQEVIVTNESYAAVARGRGGVSDNRLTVVRTGPDTSVLAPGEPDPTLRRGRRFLVHYHGVMGPQDGVDLVVETARILLQDRRRDDIAFSVLGRGDEWARLVQRVADLGLSDAIYMPGRVTDEELFAHLRTADVGLSADPPSPLNDVSTMNKTMEYMAFGVPILAFNLAETRVSAQSAAEYVAPATPEAYADAVERLLADADRRKEMGEAGRLRAVDELDWHHQSVDYVKVFKRLVG